MKNYPPEHRDIVSNLLDGRFIIYPDPLFIALNKEDMAMDYKEFFKHSYNFDLKIEADYAFLTSNDVTEKGTRDFTLFLAILSRELDYSGKNFRDCIELGSFNIAETENLLKQSSKWEILEKTTVANFDTFLNTWNKKNVIKRQGNQFKFTKAVKLFLEFAVNIAQAKLNEEGVNNINP